MVLDPLRKDTERIGKALGISGGNPGEPEIERQSGIIFRVGGITTMDAQLPDWNLSYVTYPPGEKLKFVDAFHREHINIVKITKQRIYYEE